MGKTVKYIVFTLLVAMAAVAPSSLSGQHYVGVRAGLGGGTASRIFPKEDGGTRWGLYSGGVSWKYFSPEKYVGGVEVDMLFMQQGFKNYSSPYNGRLAADLGSSEYLYPMKTDPDVDVDTTIHEKRLVNSVMIPIFWQPHIYMFRRNMRVYLNLGVTFSYNINQRISIESEEQGTLRADQKYPMLRTRDNRVGYGLCGGGGIGWSFGRVEVLGEVRYYIGYSDLMKNNNKYYGNPQRSPLDGLQGSVGVYYRFGKKGILSPPSKKMEQKLMEIEQKRLAREMERESLPPPSEGGGGVPDGELFQDGEVPHVPLQTESSPDEMAFAPGSTEWNAGLL